MVHSNRVMIIVICLLLFVDHLNSIFTPDRNDYNAYGVKMAMNDILFVQVRHIENPPTFLVQFAPYNSTQKPLQCSISIIDLYDHYIYSVAVSEAESEFFFAGELINSREGTFIGVIKINYSNIITDMKKNQSNLCHSSFSHSIEYLDQYEHEEYYKIAVRPKSSYVYGFSNKFVFVYNSKNTSSLQFWDGRLIWPNASFMPHAIHLNDDFGIIAGFIENEATARVKYVPIIFLIIFNSTNSRPIVVDCHIPSTNPATWQDLQTNSDANIYSAKYDMSVSINQYGYVLVGVQCVNRVFFLSVNPVNPTNLTYISRFTNGRAIGYGKSVAWLDNGNMAAVLVNTYSFDYDWESSQIHIYDTRSGIYNSNSTPLSVFPNYHQRLPKKFNPIFLCIVSSPISLALLDNDGNVIIFVPTPLGSFPSIQNTGSMPLITSEQSCLPGTYKSREGIHDCVLCSTGTKNTGNSSTQCVSCSASSFCPLGSSGETSLSALDETIASSPYPKSSETTTFDAVLVSNIFGITPSSCSFPPIMIYTVAIGVSLFISLVIVIFGLKCCSDKKPIARIRKAMTHFLRQIDLIDDGKSWLGGLLSVILIIVIICSCVFAAEFYHLYPIEKGLRSHFACDDTLVNAVFESSVRSLSLPQRSAEQTMIDLLAGQNFTLNVDFVNTLISCDAAAFQVLFGTTWLTARWLNCVNVNSTLSISIPLPHQRISVRILLDDIETIGGLRIGLFGNGYENRDHTLKKLYCCKSFYKNGYVLGKNVRLPFTLTKVVNETVAMESETSTFSGIFIPTFEVDLNNILLSANQYIVSKLSSISVEISLTESLYYEKNVQQPMARLNQVNFQTILVMIVILDLLIKSFLLSKLLIKPLFHFAKKHIFSYTRKVTSTAVLALVCQTHPYVFSSNILSVIPHEYNTNSITTATTEETTTT